MYRMKNRLFTAVIFAAFVFLPVLHAEQAANDSANDARNTTPASAKHKTIVADTNDGRVHSLSRERRGGDQYRKNPDMNRSGGNTYYYNSQSGRNSGTYFYGNPNANRNVNPNRNVPNNNQNNNNPYNNYYYYQGG